MSMHRYSEPFALQVVWKAIEVIRGQRQIANISRITKVVQRDHPYTPKEILHHILKAVRDNMVVETLTLGCKGSKAGMEQEGYWIPEDSDILTGETAHDPYCFQCHKPGELIRCKGCIRGYHIECVECAYRPSLSIRAKSMSTFSCKYCISKSRAGPISSEKREILNKCLVFIARRALETAPELASRPNPEEHMHYNYFIKEHQELKKLVESCTRREFTTGDEFMSRVELIEHNCILLHGEHSDVAALAKKMIETCTHELNELALCKNCYYLSSTKPTKDWFCVPCDPPHKVVWAKQKGFEYWPAKVIQVTENKLDVRFFGGHHERAWVPKVCTKSIIVGPAELQIKITKGWKKSCEEMKEYITQTERVLGAETATRMMKFDFGSQNETRSNRNPMGERAKKRKAEIRNVIQNAKKVAKVPNKEPSGGNEKGQDKASRTSGISTAESGSTPPLKWTTKRLLQDSEKHVKMFGQKAKLDEECARTWRYGTECILLYRNEGKEGTLAKIAPGKVIRYKPPQYRYRKLKCNCFKRHTRKLLNYKACVRKMMLQERNENLITSAFYIRQFLIKQSSHVQALEDEVARLKTENKRLKSHMNKNGLNDLQL